MLISIRSFFGRSALLAAAAAAVCLAAPSAAHASSIVYDLTLTSTSGTAGNGYGDFTIDSTPSGVQTTYRQSTGDLIALDFTIDNITFDLADSTGSESNTFVQFDGSTLNAIEYAGSEKLKVGNTNFTLSIGVAGLEYSFYDQATGVAGTGTISAELAPTATTPEPSSLVLLGSGFVGIAGFLRRRLTR